MNRFKKFLAYSAILTVFIVPIFTYGQNPSSIDGTPNPSSINDPGSSDTNINIPNPLNCAPGQDCRTLMGLLTILLNNVVMPIAAVAVVIWIIWAGFTYVMAQGNPTKVAVAHQRLLWSLIGAGILLGAAGISKVVELTVKGLIAP